MLHVASVNKLHAIKQAQAAGPQAPAPNDRAPSAFESLLDNNEPSNVPAKDAKDTVAKDKTAKETAAALEGNAGTAPKDDADKAQADAAVTDISAAAVQSQAQQIPGVQNPVVAIVPTAPIASPDGAQQPGIESTPPAEIPVLAPVQKVDAKKQDGETEAKTDAEDTDVTADGAEQQQTVAVAAPPVVPAAPDQPIVPVQAASVPGAADPTAPSQGGGEAIVATVAEAKGQPLATGDAVTLPQPQGTATKADKADAKADTANPETPGKQPLLESKSVVDDQQTTAQPHDPAQPPKAEQTEAAAHEDKKHIARARGESPETAHGTAARAEPALSASNIVADPATSAHGAIHTAAQQSATHAANALTSTQTPIAPQSNTPTTAPVPLASVGFEIASKAVAGENNFDIRLDPPELGRIEVRLHVDRDGNVTSHLIADRKDTLDLLKPRLQRPRARAAGRRLEDFRQRHAVFAARPVVERLAGQRR